MKSLSYLLPYAVPLAIVAGTVERQTWPFRLIMWIFVAVTLLDTVFPGRQGFPEEHGADGEGNPVWRLAIRMWLPAQGAILACGLMTVAREAADGLAIVTITVSTGMTGGMLSVPVAHELMHRRGRSEHVFAEILMSLMSYPHFCIEHVHGHHARVATADDPATARAGESLYAFLPRAVAGGFLSAWRIETLRMRRESRYVLDPRNRAFRGTLAVVAIHVVVAWFFGGRGAIFFAGQSMVAILMLETINYVQHYGLSRRATGGGYERVSEKHSWDSAHPASNWFLLNLGRHSDHHCDAGKEYRRLLHHEGAPQLPTGLFGMFILALLPPLWREIMDPLADMARVSGGKAGTTPHR
jgi:alkane 1-monooxygenase